MNNTKPFQHVSDAALEVASTPIAQELLEQHYMKLGVVLRTIYEIQALERINKAVDGAALLRDDPCCGKFTTCTHRCKPLVDYLRAQNEKHLTSMRHAAVALAHAATNMAGYNADYLRLSGAIEAAVKEQTE